MSSEREPNELLLALDYGGTKLSASLLRVGERAWARRERALSPPQADAHHDQSTMLQMASRLLAEVPGELIAVGVSFGGPVDASTGLVRLSHHVPGWEAVPLGAQLQDKFGVAVAVDNDANAAALGEWRVGAGAGSTSLLYVTISTGIGGGWVLDGGIWRGADGMAGEIGHVLVRPGGALCDCGRRGCLEAHASGLAIAKAARASVAEQPGRGTSLLALADHVAADISAELVARAAAAGDTLAQEILDEAAQMLAFALAGAISLVNPDVVVLGGGVTKSGPRYWQLIQRVTRELVLPQARVRIVPAALGDDAPLWGAIQLAQAALSQ